MFRHVSFNWLTPLKYSTSNDKKKKKNDFVKNWPSNSNLCFEKYWFSIIFGDEKLSVFNYNLKKLLRLRKNCIKIKMRNEKFYKTMLLWMTEKKILSRFSRVENSFPRSRALGELLLVVLQFTIIHNSFNSYYFD